MAEHPASELWTPAAKDLSGRATRFARHVAVGVRRGATRVRPMVMRVGLLLAIVTLSIGVRAWIISDARLVHRDDMDFFLRWTRGLTEHGLGGFYVHEGFCDYPPLSVLMFYGVGQVARVMGTSLADSTQLQIWLKLPAAFADMLIGLLLLIEGRRLLGWRGGTLAATLYMLNPVVLYDSAYWGQVDSIYTLFLLAGIVCVGRQRWRLAGAATALGLLAKFQSIALVPLILFETYRVGGWRGIGRVTVGAAAVTVTFLAPFAWTETLDDVLSRSYVDVVGQYDALAKGAYNLWHVVADPQTSDTGVPPAVAALAARGRVVLPDDASWLLGLTWRKLSLGLYALAVAVVLSLYSLRPGPVSRYGAAGLLALAFFLLPTEMHERYAFPAFALLPVWAAAAPRNERAYLALTGLILLNLAAILPARQLASQIGLANLLVFCGLLILLLVPRRGPLAEANQSPMADGSDPPTPRRRLIGVFRWGTATACVFSVVAATWAGVNLSQAHETGSASDATYLSELTPRAAKQGWRELALNRSVTGNALHLGDRVYLRGLGTHAPAQLEYDVPSGATTFKATVGVDRGAGSRGSVVASIELDGRRVYTSRVLTAAEPSETVELPVAGAGVVTLRAAPTRDGPHSDHINWALARFE